MTEYKYVYSPAGKTFVGSGEPEERRFTLLEDVFKKFPKVPINIDIKVDNDLLIKKVSDLITKYNREEYTVWGNFNDIVTRKCYAEVSILEYEWLSLHNYNHKKLWEELAMPTSMHMLQSM